MIFDSTENYISTDELSMAVDAAVKLERPLLVKGEPGTGKLNRPPKPSRAFMSTTRSLGCVILSWATSESKTSAITFARARCGRRSKLTNRLCC